MEKARFRCAAEKGKQTAERGKFAIEDEVRTEFARSGVGIAS